jgi:hypothetical protein
VLLALAVEVEVPGNVLVGEDLADAFVAVTVGCRGWRVPGVVAW